MNIETLNTWKEVLVRSRTMTEDELLSAINFEVASYARKDVLRRLHQRYNKVRCGRERNALLSGSLLI